jgi:ribonuclease HII
MATAVKVQRKFRFEYELLQKDVSCMAGVDEAGRGPLAGPVVAAAVILPAGWILAGMPRKLRKVNDSKQVNERDREELFELITQHPEIKHASGVVDVGMIDQINILNATHRAMNLALSQLQPLPQHALVDGLPVKTLNFPQTAIVDGDCLSYSIAAASIVAKVTRDRLMLEYHKQFPAYNFAAHKGYGTPEHVAAIRAHGPCPIHRQTFSPFRMVQTDFFNPSDARALAAD